MNGATRSKSLTAIDLAELKSLVLTQWKEMFARASRFQRE
jgi:hypothetical protein